VPALDVFSELRDFLFAIRRAGLPVLVAWFLILRTVGTQYIRANELLVLGAYEAVRYTFASSSRLSMTTAVMFQLHSRATVSMNRCTNVTRVYETA